MNELLAINTGPDDLADLHTMDELRDILRHRMAVLEDYAREDVNEPFWRRQLALRQSERNCGGEE
jgi:hypothetical protein